MLDGAVQDLIDELGRLPGIGPKSAQRIAFHVLDASKEDVGRLADALRAVKEKVHFCRICGNITEEDTCAICRDARRDPRVLCVVEQAKDIQPLERTRAFRGRYHVLGGVIDPINGVGPDQLRIRALLERLRDGQVREVIIATNPTVEGEATATYVARLLQGVGVTTSRIALGLPVGGDLEYADEITLGRALEGRRHMEA